MDANLVNTPSSQAIVMDNSGINSVSSMAPSPVILLPSNLMSPMILPNQQPDILQQALEAAMPNSSNASSGNVNKLPTIPIQPVAKTKEDFVTVFNSRDGTLRLTPENARALGINISTNEVVTHSANTSAHMIFEKPLMKEAQPQTVNKSPGKVIVWPSNQVGGSSGHNVTYLVRQQPVPTPVSVIRPPVVSDVRQIGQNTSLITNVLKPVMTPGIYDHTKREDIARVTPFILPKPAPVVSVAPTSRTGAGLVTKPWSGSAQTSTPIFIVTSTMPAKVTTAPSDLCGTTKYPIQLVQTNDKEFRTLQRLNNAQLTPILKMLKSNRGISNPQITYQDPGSGQKFVYRIVCKEDVEDQNNSQEIESSSNESSDDEDEGQFGIQSNSKDIVLNPHEVLKMTDQATISKILAKKRKQGRPTAFEKFVMPEPKKKRSNQLKEQFGLTIAQAQALESDIVDDKTIVEVEVKEEGLEDDDKGIEENVLSSSITRSGRLSRPPRTIVPNLIPNTSVGSILNFPNLPPPPPPPDLSQIEPKGRRKFTVPAKYRCRVCNKIYLGDRKMHRHMKAHPGHGPPPESGSDPPPPETETSSPTATSPPSAGKKISPSSLSMPIIPLARNQLEELVKNLDAELVLDVVSKKMFDNFSMWELQLKKMQLNKDSGLNRLEVMLKDMESVMVELKKMVDNCLTHTKLCDKPAPSVTIGEHLQLALNSHDGHLYLEQPNHIPEEYHKYFGIQPMISSPRSESNTLVTNPDDEDNSNSMMSGTSDKDHHHRDIGAQMVLEQNLGVGNGDEEDEDEDSNSKNLPDHQKTRSDSNSLLDNSNSKIDGLHLHGVDEDDSNMSAEDHASSSKKVSKSVVDTHQIITDPISASTPIVRTPSSEDEQPRTRLPSFSSIIAGSPKAPELQDLCLVDQPEPPQVVPVEDHHSLPSSRRGSVDHDSRPNLDIRRCSLDQTALLSAALNTSQQDSMVRRASIDNGGIMIRSSLDTTGFVDNFSSTNAEVISETGHDLLSACTLETKASEFSTLDHPHHQVSCTFANAVTTSKSSQVSDQTPTIAFSQQSIEEMVESVVTTAPTSIMSMATIDPVTDSTHVTFSQQVLAPGGVQSLPPSGPPSVHNEPRHGTSMPSSPLSSNQVGLISPSSSSKDDHHHHDFKHQNQNSSNFNLISELESVLGSAGDFSFTTPSPEKLLASIPPSSMMLVNKTSTNTPNIEPARSTCSQRTDFLGALGGKNVPTSVSSPIQQDSTSDKIEAKEVDLNSFDDGQGEHLIRSTLADVTHNPLNFPTSSTPKSNNADSLSQLFDEIPSSNPTNEQQSQ